MSCLLNQTTIGFENDNFYTAENYNPHITYIGGVGRGLNWHDTLRLLDFWNMRPPSYTASKRP